MRRCRGPGAPSSPCCTSGFGRLALTQALPLPAPVEWIGWWLFTPLATCLAWNQRRQRLVPEAVIKELARLDQRIRSATNRERQVQRHGRIR